jgi:hypothetical protein
LCHHGIGKTTAKDGIAFNLGFRLSRRDFLPSQLPSSAKHASSTTLFNATSSAITVPFANLLIINEKTLGRCFLNRLFAMNLSRGLQNAVQPGRHIVKLFSAPDTLGT